MTTRLRGRPGPALTIGIPVLTAAVLAYFGAKYFATKRQAEPATTTPLVAAERSVGSQAYVIRVAGDPWSGYSTFRKEPRLTTALQQAGLTLQYLDEERFYDQNERMKALAAGEIDLALTTLDAFLQHGSKHRVAGQYPGVIVFGIDESAGGDAIFLGKTRNSFDDISPTDRVCYAQGTPSEHLWDFSSLAFAGIGDSIKTDNGVVAKDCWEKLEAGKVEVAVLWQPYTALAEKAGYPKVFATGGQADDVIVDVAVAGRTFAAKQTEALSKLSSAYFTTIESYQGDLVAHGAFITADCGPDCAGDPALGKAVLEGIDFLTLEENACLWLGQCSTPSKLKERVGKTGRLLVAKGKLKAEELPEPASIINDSFVGALVKKRMDSKRLAQEIAGPAAAEARPEFAVVEASYKYQVAGAEQDETANVGTLALPNVFFAPGSYQLGKHAQGAVTAIADKLESFPALCVRVHGHTNSKGDTKANIELSRLRALAITNALTAISPELFPATRFDVRGFGSSKPILRGGVEDMDASRRTEFTLFKCGAALAE